MSDEKPSLDTLIDRFDHQWRSNGKPDYQTFLAQASESDRPALLAKLLAIEIEYRIRNSESINVTDYQLLGDSARQLVDQLIATHAGDGDLPLLSPSLQSVESQVGNTIGPYRLLEKIGEGGMGVVWKAQQAEPVKRLVALKLIKSGFADKQVIARFEAERQAITLMDNPHIAKVFDVGSLENGLPWFAMELVDGQPVTNYCNQHRMDVPQRLELFVQICKAVQHAHQKGIIHRDLKPSNILVKRIEGQPIPKIIDFSLAKALEGQHRLTDKTLMTEFGQLMGTIQYMSPEQASLGSVDVDTRTDIYSLGVILYQLLTGSTPIDQDTITKSGVLQVLSLIREADPPKPSRRLGSLGDEAKVVCQNMQITSDKLLNILEGDLDWVVMRALEKDRSRRYESANELAEDVQRYRDGDAVEARPPSSVYRFRKFVLKRKGLAVAGFAILTLLIAGITGTSLGLVRATREAARADQQTEAALNQKEIAETQKEIAETRTAEAIAEKKRAEFAVYNGKMNLAAQAIDDDEPVKALDILEEQIPADGNEDLRGFEWHYLWNRIHPGLEQVVGEKLSNQDAWDADFSPDGTRLAIAGFPLEIWDTTTGRLAHSFEPKIKNYPTWLRFSHSGEFLAIASRDEVQIYKDPEMDFVWGTKITDTRLARCGCWTPDDRRIFVGFDKGGALVFDAETGIKQLVTNSLPGPVNEMAVTPDGQQLYLSCEWHRDDVKKGSTHILDISESVIRRVKHLDGIIVHDISRDGKTAIGGASDLPVTLIDISDHSTIHKLKNYNLTSKCCFFPFSNMMITGGGPDRKAIVWDFEKSNRLLQLPHSAWVSDVAVAKHGNRWCSLDRNGIAKIWNANYLAALATNKPVDVVPKARFLRLMTSLADGTVLAANSTTKLLNIDAAGNRPPSRDFPGTIINVTNDGRYVACLPNGKKPLAEHEIVVCNRDGVVEKELKVEAPGGKPQPILQGLLTRDGRYLLLNFPSPFPGVGWTIETLVVIQDLDDLTLPAQVVDADRVMDMAVSPTRQYFATASQGGAVGIWDPATGLLVEQVHGHLNATGFATVVEFSADGKYLAAGFNDGSTKIWDVLTIDSNNRFYGATNLENHPDDTRPPDFEFKGGSVAVFSLAFFPAAKTLAIASDDGVRLVDLKYQQERITLKAPTAARDLLISSDGKTIFARCKSGETRIFRADSNSLK